MIHYKKCQQPYFEELFEKRKRFEIRKEDDCRYKPGDAILLYEVNQNGDTVVTPLDNVPIVNADIGYVLRDFEGLASGWVAIQLNNIDPALVARVVFEKWLKKPQRRVSDENRYHQKP